MQDHWISNRIFETKTFNAFTLKDYRILSEAEQHSYGRIIKAAMITAIPEILCGGPETEHIALAIENIRREGMDAEETTEFITAYRAASSLRTTAEQFTGDGTVRFALFSGVNLIGSVIITQSSILARNGATIDVKITPLMHRRNVPVLNPSRTAITAAWTNDQASLIRYMLNNTFAVEDSSLIIKPTLVDPHPRNGRFETLQAVVDYDVALTAIMDKFPEITTVVANEGARPYNMFTHV